MLFIPLIFLSSIQENDQIYYTSTRDIELGDILKVWYSPSYATRMGVSLLPSSDNPNVCTNILKQVSFDYGIKLHDDVDSDVTNNNYLAMAPTTSSPSSEITLPPINSLMKTQSPNYNNLDFDNLILMAKNEQLAGNIYQTDYIDSYQMSLHDQITSSDSEKTTQSPSSSGKNIKFTDAPDNESQKFHCELCARKYITKSNLEKHMRSHDLFMCVVCMKVSKHTTATHFDLQVNFSPGRCSKTPTSSRNTNASSRKQQRRSLSFIARSAGRS